MILLKINNLKWWSRGSVFLVFCLIFIGALVTSWQAGMAVPDWPLSFGSLNPEGWWSNFPVRLEHGHRVLAAFVGVVVGVLSAAVWGNWRALGFAFGVSVLASGIGSLLHLPAVLRAHLGIWPAAFAFVTSLLVMGSSKSCVGRTERTLALAAFILVCCQATLGGLRVTQETEGFVGTAVVLRIIHGCIAQAFLVCLAALSVRVGILAAGPSINMAPIQTIGSGLKQWLWLALVSVYAQLIVGASMRHLGAGLAIPSFPAANPEGGWLPKTHNLYTDLNFPHTRLGALFVAFVVCLAVFKTLRSASQNDRLRFWAFTSGVLVLLQACLGVLVVLHQKPKTLATLHVVLGAGLLASLTALLVNAFNSSKTEPEVGLI